MNLPIDAPPHLTQRIHAAYSALPEGEKRAADLILDSPGELALWTASELAARAQVSNATVSRLFQRLGYVNYEEARREIRSLREQGSPLYQGSMATFTEWPEGEIDARLQNEVRRIEMALRALGRDTRDQIGERLAKAPRVRIAGFRNSRFLAEYFTAALSQFRPNVSALVPAGQTLAEGLAELGEGDVVFIIGFRRRPVFFGQFVDAALATGAHVALLSDPSIRRAPARVDWSIICPVESLQPLDSYSAALVTLRSLAIATLAALGKKGRHHLERIESIHASLSELE